MSAHYLDEAVSDLLVKLACEGLTDAERIELESLRASSPQLAAAMDAELHAYEEIAAAVTLSAPGLQQPMPEDLRALLVNDARALASTADVIPLPLAVSPSSMPHSAKPEAGRPVRGSKGWWAAAAALVLALFLGTRSGQAPPAVASLAAQRAALLAHADALKLNWKPTPNEPAAAAVQGDVVWDPATRTGYMRFVGLAKNDAARQQYQLWIFDAARDARYPVDGGVFNAPGGDGEVLIPIRPPLAVTEPQLFAVTLEKAGGVVVSAREHIVVTAQPG